MAGAWQWAAAALILGLTMLVLVLWRALCRQRDAEAMRRATEQQLRLLAEHSHDLVCLLDRRWRRSYASPASRALMGRDPAVLVGRSLLAFVQREDRAALRKALARLQAGHASEETLTYRLLHAQGHSIWIESTVRVIRDDATSRRRGAVEVTRDITARKRQEHRLRMLAEMDALTGLPNRRAFDAALEREWQRCAAARLPISLVLIDVDHFKAFNDHHGHAEGDACLRQVAQALAGAVRTGSSDLVARHGGEEFVLLLPETGQADALKVAERLRQAVVAQGLRHGGRRDGRSVVSISLGLASCLPQPGGAADLLEAADQALYRAKDAGRDAVAAAPMAAD